MYRKITILWCALISISVNAANLPDFPFVISNGWINEDVTPDEAEIHIYVLSFSKTSKGALSTVNQTSDKIIELLKKYSISIDQLEATDVEKNIERRRDKDHNPLEILGYEVSRKITIHLQNLKNYSELMSDLVSIDNISEVSTDFDVSNREVIESKLIAKASEDAKNKADNMAKSLGASIDSVYAISQYSDFEEALTTFRARSYSVIAGGKEQTTTMFVPKSIEISLSIYVMFKLKN